MYEYNISTFDENWGSTDHYKQQPPEQHVTFRHH